MIDHAPTCKVHRFTRLAAGVALALATACTQFPEVAAMPADPTPEIPMLLPLDDLVAQGQVSAVAEPAGDALTARGAGLRDRAARLRAEAAQP